MDKRTLIAVVISVVIISASFGIQALFFSPKDESTTQVQPENPAAETTLKTIEVQPVHIRPAVLEAAIPSEIRYSTSALDVVFNTRGASIQSFKLRGFQEADGSLVEMVLSEESKRYPINLYLEEYDTGRDVFIHESGALPDIFTFSKKYIYRESGREIPFLVRKTYMFKKDEHMIEVRVNIETETGTDIPVKSYTLSYGPQIGPDYEKLDGRQEFRRYIYYAEGKRKDFSRKLKNTRQIIDERVSWLGVEGKYFLIVGISYVSDLSKYSAGFDATPKNGIRDRSSLFFTRTIGNENRLTDGYKFYIGPKKKEILERYNEAEKNAYGESGLDMEKAIRYSFWDWLSTVLKWGLQLFYRIIPNWGVAIILLTILIKIVFYPLTKKSFDSTSKMQALGPKIEEVKQKYKDNSQKMNQEVAALYKKEGVNPLGGCLPMLLQMPILLAMFQLFNNFFELRGAPFISPWISDLSSPEKVLTFPFTIPFVGSELRLLPFVMLATTFVQQMITKNPGQTSKQNKLLMYGMPLFFFFIMYNMPSGLLLYWTMQSFLSFIQQYFTNSRKRKKQQGETK